jgi:SPP1 family predicted phage head-tail adaptor
MLPRRISTGFAPTPIGALNSKIDIEKVLKRDGSGNAVWDVFAANVWARIQTLTSTYKEKSQQSVSEATHKIVIRYMDGVTSAMRIKSEGRIYEIEGSPSDPDGSRRELWINCYMRNDGVSGVQA